MIFASEVSRRTARQCLTALLVTVVPAVVGAIAHGPLWDAAVVRFTAEFCVVVTAVGSTHALMDGLVRVVPTVIIYVALPGLRDAAAVVTPELARPAGPAGTVRTVLVRAIQAVTHGVTLPGLWDAALVGTLPLVELAAVVLTKSLVFIRTVVAILASIAQGLGAGAVTVPALELPQPAEAMRAQGRFIGTIRAVLLSVAFPPDGNALFIVSAQKLGARAGGQAESSATQTQGLEVIRTLAGEPISSCLDEAKMRTTTIVGTTRIVHNRLPVGMVHVDVKRSVCRVHQHHPI